MLLKGNRVIGGKLHAVGCAMRVQLPWVDWHIVSAVVIDHVVGYYLGEFAVLLFDPLSCLRQPLVCSVVAVCDEET